jgi:hypothetical protein
LQENIDAASITLSDDMLRAIDDIHGALPNPKQ